MHPQLPQPAARPTLAARHRHLPHANFPALPRPAAAPPQEPESEEEKEGAGPMHFAKQESWHQERALKNLFAPGSPRKEEEEEAGGGGGGGGADGQP